MLHSTKAQVGYHWKRFGQVQLSKSPQSFLEEKFEQMSKFAALSVDHLPTDIQTENIDAMAEMGLELFEELLSEELQREYWQRIRPLREDGVIQSLLITSDEPWIPWELIKPYQYDINTKEEVDDGFLAEDFQLSRWLAGNGPVDEIMIQTAQIVAPELDLHYVRQEKNYFDSLKALGIDVEPPLQSKNDVIRRAKTGGIEILHFSTHGLFDAENPDRSLISLKDSALRPSDLSSRKSKGLQDSRPLVFLNACHTGRIEVALTGLGGWAEKFVSQIGVSAFIGSLWEVNDQLAAEFAIKFYDELQAGKMLGEAFHSARLTIKERQPANPTWLAYTLYGDPNSKVVFKVEAEVKVEEEGASQPQS